jgi:Protein of unknown function, DUF547
MRLLLWLMLLISSSSFAVEIVTPTIAAPPLDDNHSTWATVLHAVVKSDGVDYATLRGDSSALDRYRVQLAQAKTPIDKNEKMAFYINAYNAFTLALVTQQLPADKSTWKRWSIKDAGGWFTNVWKYYSFELAGERVTLDQLEHALLRPLGDPRIHFAINCASRSCPSLIDKPFLAATLDQQLTAVTQAFANNPYHLRLVNDVIVTNPILSWFAEDFKHSGGVPTFLQSYVKPSPLAQQLASGTTLTYFTYDWSLNLSTTK